MTALDQPVDDGTVGIVPVPASLHRLRAVDIGVLWGDLSIGVLVLAAGARRLRGSYRNRSVRGANTRGRIRRLHLCQQGREPGRLPLRAD
jgi:hypothetical protein